MSALLIRIFETDIGKAARWVGHIVNNLGGVRASKLQKQIVDCDLIGARARVLRALVDSPILIERALMPANEENRGAVFK
jgi:hypothetical protein